LKRMLILGLEFLENYKNVDNTEQREFGTYISFLYKP